MALYAYDGDKLVYAASAIEKKIYRCRGCQATVRVRRGPQRVPHFFHQTRSPACRLYSKSEDHLLAQLAIQALLPPGEAKLEHPVGEIHRIADVLWETQKIAFEIQCSLLTSYEVEKRIRDYASAGFKIVWILDDRIYNKRRLRPAEALVRRFTCYYAALRRQSIPTFYDQFEILGPTQRIKKGHRLKIRLDQPNFFFDSNWKKEDIPLQILQKAAPGSLYFRGDLIHRALLAQSIPEIQFAMQNLRALETLLTGSQIKEPALFKRILLKWVLEPFGLLMLNLMEWAEKRGRIQ